MPKEGISIYFTIQDGGSQVLKSIADQTKALDKETQSLVQEYAALDAANKPLITKQNELKTALEESKTKVKDATKAFRDLGDEASKLTMKEAIEEQDNLKRELKDVEDQLKSNQSAFSSYREDLRKGAMETGGIAESAASGGSSLLSTLGQAGLWQALGSTASELGSMFVSSAYGSEGSTMFSSILGSAGTGAAIGTMIAPGIGTAIGAVLGGAVGALTGSAEIAKNKDEAFIEYYNSLYESVSDATESTISSGSTTAGSREQTQMAFAKRLGSSDAADAYLAQVEEFAAFTNYSYDEITAYAKLLMNTYNPDEVFDVLQSLSDATAGLSLSESDIQVMISGLSRMRTTGKTTMEYLNYFSERGVDVYSALAEPLGVDKSAIAEMVSGGEIGGEFAAQAILDYIDQQYGGLSEDLMSTYDAMADNLNDIMTSIAAAGGEGYNEARKSGLEAEADAYSGALGEAVASINRIAGENQAYLENLSEQFQREALSAVLLGEETTLFSPADQDELEEMRAAYEDASAEYAAGSQEAGLKMEALKEEAEALATAAYESSDQYQIMQDVELDQIAAIRENTAGLAAATNAYTLAQEKSKGVAATSLNGAIFDKNGELTEEAAYWNSRAQRDLEMWGMGNAYGLDRVPYDEYPALLHEGERVLTAQEARAQDAAGGKPSIQIVVSGNQFTGTGEEMADELAEVIARKLEQAAVAAVPR